MRCLVVASEVGGRGGVSGGWVVRSCSGVWVGVVGAIELAKGGREGRANSGGIDSVAHRALGSVSWRMRPVRKPGSFCTFPGV
jgi:hypothetical protein